MAIFCKSVTNQYISGYNIVLNTARPGRKQATAAKLCIYINLEAQYTS